MDNLIYQKIWRKVVRIEIKCLISVIGSKILKKDNINTLTKQTLFDHINNVAMSSNNNTRSTKINAVSNTIENQLSKQPITKLFKNLEETETEELNIDSAAQEVEEMLKNYRHMKHKIIPAPLYASDTGDRTENINGDGDGR